MSDVSEAGATVETVQPPTFDESLNAEITKLFDAADAAEGGQARAPDGRFQKLAVEAAPADDGKASTPNESADQIPDAPAWWSDEVKPHWATAAPEVRKFLIDRDGEVQKQLTEHGEKLKAYEALEQVLAPRREGLAKGFGTVEQAVEYLFTMSDAAGKDFPGFVKHMVAQRGMDLPSFIALLGGAPAAASTETPPADAAVDPELAALKAEIAELKGKQNDREQAELQEIDRKAAGTISAFVNAKSDKGEPLHPHFEQVKVEMGRLMKANRDWSIERAYKIAVTTDEKLQTKIAEDAAKAAKAKEEAEAKEKAAKARKAVGADMRTTSGSTAAQRGSIDDTLRAEIDKRFASGA